MDLGRPMELATDLDMTGHAGYMYGCRWQGAGERPPEYLVLLCHGYGEHIRRYDWVAERFVDDGAAVYGVDHAGHGRSEGERVLIDDFDAVIADVRLMHDRAVLEHPGTPVVLVGHSMGGMIAARYAQLHGSDLACTVLSGPVMGHWAALEGLLAADEIPDDPIDPDVLSRVPAVGQAYLEDPLVWHGPFKRPTLEALGRCIESIQAGVPIGHPVLWLHGRDDQLVPYEGSAAGWPVVRGESGQDKSYDGARHEIFNESNRDEVLDDVIGFVRDHLPPA